MKLIGLDVGTKRIGVAKADSSVKIAVPQCTISVDGTEFDQIARLARVHGTKFFVVGLPRNSKGEETAQSKYSRDFAAKLQKTIPGAKVAFQDESLTSIEAENNLKNRKKNYSKGDIDAEAAALILQDFLENFTKGKMKTEEYAKTGVMPAVKHKKKLSKTLKTVIISVASLAIIAITFFSISYFNALKPVAENIPCSTEDEIKANLEICQYKTIDIEEGMALNTVAQVLRNKSIIKNEFYFKVYAYLHGKAGSVKAGRYSFNRTAGVAEILDILTDAAAGVVTFRITTLPGGTLNDFKEILRHNGYTDEEIEEGLSKVEHPVLKSKPADASLEGYIFGETIEYQKGASVEEIAKKFLDELYEIVIAFGLEGEYAKQGLSLHEGIVLASIVQKEAKSDDMPSVAGVFLNRLKYGMSLGSDVTVSYAADQIDPERKIYTDNASLLEIDSCYNTRKNAGLPCGPISNPGVTALKSVAFPDVSNNLYFLTGDDGMMYYSTTEEGHISNMRNYCQTLCGVSL